MNADLESRALVVLGQPQYSLFGEIAGELLLVNAFAICRARWRRALATAGKGRTLRFAAPAANFRYGSEAVIRQPVASVGAGLPASAQIHPVWRAIFRRPLVTPEAFFVFHLPEPPLSATSGRSRGSGLLFDHLIRL